MKSLLLVLMLAGAVYSQEQTLDPKLAPLVQKQRADLDTLGKQVEAAKSRLGKVYLDALSAAEKSATSAGQLNVVAEVIKERESMDQGLEMSAEAPAGLPATLKSPRQNYILGLKKITAESAERRQRIYADYLRNLATLGTGAVAGSELAKQIAAEKTALLQNATATATTATTSKRAATPTGSNKIVNGDFTEAGPDGFPKAWSWNKLFEDHPKDGSTLPPAVTVKSMNENREAFVQVTYKECGGALGQAVEIPPRAKEVVLRLRARGKQTGEDGALYAFLHFYNKDRKRVGQVGKDGLAKLSPKSWKSFDITKKIPDGCVYVGVQLGFYDVKASGTFDFQRVELIFR